MKEVKGNVRLGVEVCVDGGRRRGRERGVEREIEEKFNMGSDVGSEELFLRLVLCRNELNSPAHSVCSGSVGES